MNHVGQNAAALQSDLRQTTGRAIRAIHHDLETFCFSDGIPQPLHISQTQEIVAGH